LISTGRVIRDKNDAHGPESILLSLSRGHPKKGFLARFQGLQSVSRTNYPNGQNQSARFQYRRHCRSAEMEEMVRLGAGVPDDEHWIEMIKGQLARWHRSPVIILDAVESYFQSGIVRFQTTAREPSL
jgi:hypothetical protein